MLDEERAYFKSHRDELVQRYKNLFVLIKGDALVGALADGESAYKEGVNKFGLEPFLVKQVLEVEPVLTIPMFSATRAHL